MRWGSDEWKWSISIVSAVIRSAGAALTFTCACALAVRSGALAHVLQQGTNRRVLQGTQRVLPPVHAHQQCAVGLIGSAYNVAVY